MANDAPERMRTHHDGLLGVLDVGAFAEEVIKFEALPLEGLGEVGPGELALIEQEDHDVHDRLHVVPPALGRLAY